MDSARKISDDDELRAIGDSGAGYVIDPFTRRWHLATCPHLSKMRTGQPKWFASSPGARDQYLQERTARYPSSEAIRACSTCGSGAELTAPDGAGTRSSRPPDEVPPEEAAQVRNALRAIISDYGVQALASPAQLANLQKDLLPDAPDIGRMLLATAEERITDQLRDLTSGGLDGTTAVRMAASSFASRTRYDPRTCTWLISEIADALGVLIGTGYPPTIPASTPIPQPQPNTRRPEPPLEEHDGDETRALLRKLQTRGHAPSLQAIYDGLRNFGYIPHTPESRQPGGKQKQYLRWTDPARGGPAVLYLETSTLWFVRTEDLTTLADFPAGTTTLGGRHHNVRFPISTQTTRQILTAAQRIKR